MIEYNKICRRVSARPATTGSIGIPARAYSSARHSDSAQKWGGVQKNMIRNNSTDSRPIVPVAAAQPIIGGDAPAAPPPTKFCRGVRLSRLVESAKEKKT